MLRSLTRVVLLTVSVVSLGASATLTGTISGTCGFYQGTISNVVYSQSFSGDGSFCTGFLPGGSFTNTGVLEGGDIYALSHNTIEATAPAGYGVFAKFATTYEVTQQYVITPSMTPGTATGYVKTFVAATGGTDDGSGLGSCSEHASLKLGGFSVPNGVSVMIPITFGLPITAIETASVSCNDYGAPGRGFGDDGRQEVYAGLPLSAYDANGKFLGEATLSTVTPEPSYVPVLLLVGLGLSIAISGRPNANAKSNERKKSSLSRA